jgi:hypothetical protein
MCLYGPLVFKFKINTYSYAFKFFKNFCKSPSLLNIWYRNSDECGRFPSIIIVGPQKTGLIV